MSQFTTTTMGIDIGDRFSQMVVLNEQGQVEEEARVRTTPEAIRQFLSHRSPMRVALEVGTHSPWLSRLLTQAGHEVLVANAGMVRLIFCSGRKDDRIDAERLARLARVDARLLHPIEHRSEANQAHQALLRARDALVRSRTLLINTARGLVKSFGARLPCCSSASFAKHLDQVPKALQPVFKDLFRQIAQLSAAIKGYDRRVEKATASYPEAAHLREIGGVGPVVFLGFVTALGDPRRFRRSRSVGAYLGLCPRRSQSGDWDPELRISKKGNPYVRRLLVSSAQYILGPFGRDCALRRWGLALAARGGKNAKKRAVVGVARKLAILMHRLWVSAEVYDPFYGLAAA